MMTVPGPICCSFAPLWLPVPRSPVAFLFFLIKAAHSIGWLCAFADPVFDSINVQRTIVTGFLWVVRADDLDKFPIARDCACRPLPLCSRAILRSFSA
jgi:hypothetical protein